MQKTKTSNLMKIGSNMLEKETLPRYCLEDEDRAQGATNNAMAVSIEHDMKRLGFSVVR